MNQQQAAASGDESGLERPSVLSELTATQLAELRQQYDEGDREAFDTRARSYGWTSEQAQAVWIWLGTGSALAEGRVDVIEGSPVYPASGPQRPSGDAPARDMAAFGQGERGIAGYEDHGESEPVWVPPSDSSGRR